MFYNFLVCVCFFPSVVKKVFVLVISFVHAFKLHVLDLMLVVLSLMTNEGKELRMHGMQIGIMERILDLESDVPVLFCYFWASNSYLSSNLSFYILFSIFHDFSLTFPFKLSLSVLDFSLVPILFLQSTFCLLKWYISVFVHICLIFFFLPGLQFRGVGFVSVSLLPTLHRANTW